MSAEKVAVVTGANKGIGFSIVKGLLERWSGVVYLTCRDVPAGHEAAATLPACLQSRVRVHELDVSKAVSVQAMAGHIASEHGGLDILVNNAAIAFLGDTTPEQDEETIAINYGSLALMETHMFPLLRPGGRVLNISSDCGHLSNLLNSSWRARLISPELIAEDIDAFVQWYLRGKRDGTWQGDKELVDNGTAAAYRIAKMALSARTRLQARSDWAVRQGIAINSMHPGLVRTNMTRGVGFYSTDQAAETPLQLLLDASPSLSGQYVWFDGRQLDWTDHTADYWFKSSTLQA